MSVYSGDRIVHWMDTYLAQRRIRNERMLIQEPQSQTHTQERQENGENNHIQRENNQIEIENIQIQVE